MEESLVASGYVEVERQEANSGILMNSYTHVCRCTPISLRRIREENGSSNFTYKDKKCFKKAVLKHLRLLTCVCATRWKASFPTKWRAAGEWMAVIQHSQAITQSEQSIRWHGHISARISCGLRRG